MNSSQFDINGARVLITGAGRGIGPGIGEVLSMAGAQVALNALTRRFVDAAASRIAAASGQPVHPIVGDVTTLDGSSRVVEDAMELLGGIDVLINNLGDALIAPLVAAPGSDTEPMPESGIDLALDLNLRSALVCARSVGPHFLAQGSGNLINVSSLTAFKGGSGMSVYAAAKAGLIGFTRALALEWAPHVRVNSIAPGWFPDPLQMSEVEFAQLEAAAAALPAGRLGDPREVGHLAQFLIAPASDYITGQTILIDGGATLG